MKNQRATSKKKSSFSINSSSEDSFYKLSTKRKFKPVRASNLKKSLKNEPIFAKQTKSKAKQILSEIKNISVESEISINKSTTKGRIIKNQRLTKTNLKIPQYSIRVFKQEGKSQNGKNNDSKAINLKAKIDNNTIQQPQKQQPSQHRTNIGTENSKYNLAYLLYSLKKIYFNFKRFIEFSSLGFNFYLFSKTFTHLFLRHLVYLMNSLFFNYEYFLIVICGLVRSFYLLLIFVTRVYAKTNEKYEYENRYDLFYYTCISFGSELALSILFGLLQFTNQMTIWDHKKKIILKPVFRLELAKYFIETSIILIIFVFYFCKYKRIKF